MGLTSLFLEMKNKNVLIVGTGSVGIRRSRRFLESEANVAIVTKHIDPIIEEELLSKGAKFYDNDKLDELIDWCDLVVVATDDLDLNREISLKASNKLVNCASDIDISNVIVPSTFDIGTVKVSLYTGSRSPLMAKELRKKIQSIISSEDILNIELQEYIRSLLKIHVESQVDRKEYMIQFKNDDNIKEFISNNDIDSAKKYVKNFIEQIN